MFWRRSPANPCAIKMAQMNEILEQRHFATYQQRIVALTATNQDEARVHGVELLNRPRANSTFQSPDQFYAFAATHGKSPEVDVFTIQMAFDRWRVAPSPPTRTPSIPLVFVNIHLSTLFSQHWEDLVHRLPDLEVDPGFVVLELSEREGLDTYSNESVQMKIHQLQELGFRIAVDDLGMGYSGLYTLATVQPDYVKVDRQLVQGIDRDPYRQHMMNALVEYWKKEGVTVIAEGVERAPEAQFFFAIGTDLVQGYYFHRPVEVAADTPALQPAPVG